MLNLPLPGAIDPITPIPHQDPIYYLDKRLFMDDEVNNANSFFIYTMKKNEWRLFRWKVQCQWCVFSLANDPAWTLHKGPWVGDFYECIKEYSELFSGNCSEVIDGCFTRGYIYFRSLMPALASQLQWKKKKETFINCVKNCVNNNNCMFWWHVFLDFLHQQSVVIPDLE